MKTMALTEETVPHVVHSKVRSVVARSLPQSSAFTIRQPVAAKWSGLMPADGISTDAEDEAGVCTQAATALLLDRAIMEGLSSFIG
jgi:hypothetical protein